MKEPGTATLDSYNCSFLQIPEFLPGEPEEFGNPGDRFVSCLRGFDSSSLRCHFGAHISTWAELSFWLFVFPALGSRNHSGHRAGICIIWIMLGDVCSSVVVPCTCGDHTGQV